MKRLSLLLSAFFIFGCGGGKDAPQNATVTEPNPATVTPSPAPAPAPAADLHEMDPAKHVLPSTPATGRLAGKPFTPDRVELQGDRLTFRQGKDFFADAEIVVNMQPDKRPAPGAKLVVAPAQKWHEAGVSSLAVSLRKDPQGVPDTAFVNDGYALTLELGAKDKGKVPGKVYLCLPGAARSYLAGTFEAEWQRDADDPPTAADAPFIQGAIKHPGKKDQMLTAGYVGLTGDESVTDLAGTTVPGPGEAGGWAQSATFKPRVATLAFRDGAARFEFARLPPGRYLVYARLRDGPAAWTTVEVAAGGQVTRDVAIDGGNTGTVEVTTPKDFKGQVRLAPADLGLADDRGLIAGRVAFALDLGAEVAAGKATIRHVPAGKYALYSTPGKIEPRGTVDVAAGKTATVEMQAEKK